MTANNVFALHAEGPPEPEPDQEQYAGYLPPEAWQSTEQLGHIYQAAMATYANPDAVLQGVLAVIASQVHHQTRVDTGIRPSPLCYYCTSIGRSGGGKSETMATVRDLMQEWVDGRFAINGDGGYIDATLGTGEGLVESFMGEAEEVAPGSDSDVVRVRKVRKQVRHNALFNTDEGRMLMAIDSRKGATIMGVLCELWSGSQVGQTNADKERCRKLARGSYTVGVILGFQEEHTEGLFGDAAGGTPQRFMFATSWYPPQEENVGDYEHPGSLHPDIPVEAVTVELKPEHKAEVKDQRRLRAAGIFTDENPLNGHKMLLRVRTAALLALLHGSLVVEDDMWDLAGLMVDRSCDLRDHLAGRIQRQMAAVREANAKHAVDVKIRAAVATEDRTQVMRALDAMVTKLESTGGSNFRGRTKNAITASLRPYAEKAIEVGIAQGILVEEDRGGRIQLVQDHE